MNNEQTEIKDIIKINDGKPVKEKKNIKIPVWLIILVILAVTLFAVYKSTEANNVTVTGLTKYSDEEFLQKAGFKGFNKNTYLYMLKDKNGAKASIPYIDTYYVEMKDKNTLLFTVYETGVIGCVKIMGDYFSFDKDGRVIRSSKERPEGVPLVKGLEFDEIIMFQKLKVPRQNVFDVVLEIIRMVQKYNLDVGEIEFGNGLEVTLYTDNLKILLGIKDKYDASISALSSVYEEAAKRGGTIDLRNYSEDNPDIVLRTVGN